MDEKHSVCLPPCGRADGSRATARFTGQVTDQQNAAIPNANVWVVNQDSQVRVQTKTDASGIYIVPYLPAGRYRIEVEVPGFKQAMSNDLNLGMAQL